MNIDLTTILVIAGAIIAGVALSRFMRAGLASYGTDFADVFRQAGLRTSWPNAQPKGQ